MKHRDFRCATMIEAGRIQNDYVGRSVDAVDPFCFSGPNSVDPAIALRPDLSLEGTTITPGNGAIIDSKGRSYHCLVRRLHLPRRAAARESARTSYGWFTPAAPLSSTSSTQAGHGRGTIRPNTWDLLTSPPPDPAPPSSGGGPAAVSASCSRGGSSGGGSGSSSGNTGSASGSGTNVNVQVSNTIQVAGATASAPLILKISSNSALRRLAGAGLSASLTCPSDCNASGRLTRGGKTVATAATVRGNGRSSARAATQGDEGASSHSCDASTRATSSSS